jgi:hypothetical protein
MKWNIRRTAVAVIVLPAVLGVAACGKSETPAPSTGQTQSTSTSAAPAAGQKIAVTGDTKVDADNLAMKMSMDMGPSMKLDMILVDKKVYMKGFPGLAAGKWAVIDSNSAMGKQLSEALDQADPTKMYDQFGAAVTDVKYVGEDTVDGAKAYKYDLTLDTKAMRDQLPTDSGTKLPDTITYTAWLDEKDHLRKVTFEVSGVKAEMTMSKYGEPVDIKAPAAADTVKAPM